MKCLKIILLSMSIFLVVACAKTTIKPVCVNHSFDDGIVLREKGCNVNGIIKYTCKICGYQKEEIIPMGHRYYYEEIGEETHIKKCLDCEVEVKENHIKELRSIGSEDPILRCKYCNEGSLPRIDIKTSNKIVKNKYVSCTISTSNYLDDYLFENEECEIKVRGNATANYNKKPFRLKFKTKQSMFGLNDGLKAKSWVLLAGYVDKTMMNDALGFFLAKNIYEDEYYYSDYKFVEVYINGSYNGLYTLVEQQQINKSRFNITESKEDEPNNVKIGYLLELDYYYYNEENYIRLYYDKMKFYSSEAVPLSELHPYYTIKSDIYSNAQKTYIQKWLQNIYNVVYDAFYHDHTSAPYQTLDDDGNIITDESIKTAEECAERVIDVRSLVDTCMIMELTENLDIGYSSFYMDIDLNPKNRKKLTFDGPWDFEWTFGNAIYETDIFYTGNKYRGFMGKSRLANPWIVLFMNQGWFMRRLIEKWDELEKSNLYERTINYINDTYNNYHKFFDKNFKKWNECLYHNTFGPAFINNMHTQKEAYLNMLEYVKNKYKYLSILFN